MATVNFIIRGKNVLSTIYARVKDGRTIDLTTTTDLLINPLYWSKRKGEVKQSSEFKEKLNLTNKLEDLRTLLLDNIQAEKLNGKELTSDWLKSMIDIFHKRVKDQSLEFIYLMQQKKESLSERINKPSPLTLKCYNTTIKRLEKFEEHKNQTLYIKDIDLTFHSDYVNFASKVLGLSINSIGKDLRQIKTVCFDAKDRGIQINEQAISKRFNSPSEKTDFVTLTEIEIIKIKNFTGPNYLCNARDWLIIGCWTGCRVKDLIELTSHKILKNIDGKDFIRYTQNKTKKTVDIPLHPHVIEIIERLQGFPREISDVKFNFYIKEVCKRVGITNQVYGSKQNKETGLKETGMFPKSELIRSHTCRRSFATNHYNKLPNKVIMAVTGHSTEKQFLEYIGEQENTHLNEFIDVWGQEPEKIHSINKLT
jgi:integrase